MLLLGILLEKPHLAKDERAAGLRYIIRSPRSLVIDALYTKMMTLVSLIEERPNGADNVPDFIALCDQIVSSKLKDMEILIMCAQGYIKGIQYEKAEQPLWNLLEREPNNARVAGILFVSVNSRGDRNQLAKLSNWIIVKHKDRQDFASQFLCARVAGALQD